MSVQQFEKLLAFAKGNKFNWDNYAKEIIKTLDDPQEYGKYFIWLYNNHINYAVAPYFGVANVWRDYEQKQQPQIKKKPDVMINKMELDCFPDLVAEIPKTKKAVKKNPFYKNMGPGKSSYPTFLIMMSMLAFAQSARQNIKIPDKGREYILPKDFKVYHGSNSTNSNFYQKNFTGVLWLTGNMRVAAQYAMRDNLASYIVPFVRGKKNWKPDNIQAEIYEFTTKKDTRLFRVSLENILWLHKEYPEMKAILDHVFPIEDGVLGRNSILDYDWVFSYYLCNVVGFDGYIAPPIGTMHAEIMFCKINLTKPKMYAWSGKTLTDWVVEMGWVPLLRKNLKDDTVKLQITTFLRSYAQLMKWPLN